MKIKMYRQGDVLIREIKEIPKEAKLTADPVLAYGETTNHKHLMVGAVQVMEDQRQKYLDVDEEGAQLVHEEHGAISFPKGKYSVTRQREYSPLEKRLVMD